MGGFPGPPQGQSVHHSGSAAGWRRPRQTARARRALSVPGGTGEISPRGWRQPFLIGGGQIMARGGYRFFDTDAHVGPYVDVLEPYLTDDDKSRLTAWAPYRATSKNGHI